MARLYSNENFPLPVVENLRAKGHDVVTIQEAGHADAALPDEKVLALATAENRALVTLNRLHFIRLHQKQPNTPELSSASLMPISKISRRGLTRQSTWRFLWWENLCA